MSGKVIYITENKKKVAQAKLMWIIADIIGLPVAFLGIITNLDNVKSAIIAILAIAYLMLRLYFYFVQKQQAIREKEYELWEKEMNKQDRILKMAKEKQR